MPCEMCGDEASLAKVLVERSTLMLCPKCSRFGKVLELPKPKLKRAPAATSAASSSFSRSARPAGPAKPRDELEAASTADGDLREDLGKIVFAARMRMNLTQDDLGKKISEKKSVISELETGRMRPDHKLVRKLERTLNVKLTGAKSDE